MGTLCYSLLESESDLQSFDCGNDTINQRVSNSFYSNLLKQSQTYKITLQGYCVGFFSFSITHLNVENSDAPIADFYDNTPSYGALQIDFIAIDKRIQKRGIGTQALAYFIMQATQIYKIIPIRVLILDALRDKFDWYVKLGFAPVKSSDKDGTSATIQMYRDLMPDDDRSILEQYIAHI